MILMTTEMKLITLDEEMQSFWSMFDTYINELANNATQGDGIELDYYNSSEYRDAVDLIRKRDENPIRLHLIFSEDTLVGFSMYQLLFDTDKNCCLMEYYIADEHRGKGLGKIAYDELEKIIEIEGVESIELTPTNEINRRFWEARGYCMTDEIDEDNKHIFKKTL